MLLQCIFVGIGGFLGAISRYLISTKVQILSKSTLFPYGTLAANMVGCLIIGVMFGLVVNTTLLGESLQNLIITGFLGALTTFSTFGFETYALVRGKAIILAVVNILAQIIIGIVLVWLGFLIAGLFF